MRRAATLALLAALGIGLTACEEGSLVINDNPRKVEVWDDDGHYDWRQVNEACLSVGQRVVRVVKGSGEDGHQHALVYCERPR